MTLLHANRCRVTRGAAICLVLLSLSGCERSPSGTATTGSVTAAPLKLADARQGFTTRLLTQEACDEPIAEPPPKLFTLAAYDGPLGKMPAYVSPDPGDGQKHPVIIWLVGGFSNSIGDNAWLPAEPENDQSAAQYREAGLLMVYPSLRGGCGTPGHIENCCGEVEDVAAAARWVKTLPYVDPQRVYLGGHSTGGTLTLLTVAYCNEFRGAIAFGPVSYTCDYGPPNLVFDCDDDNEVRLRAPIEWLDSIQTPTLVLEGADGNTRSLEELQQRSRNPLLRFYAVERSDHFSILAPTNRLLARRLLADTGPTHTLPFEPSELASEF